MENGYDKIIENKDKVFKDDKKSAAKDLTYIKKVMERVENIKPSPIFWMLWGLIVVFAGIIIQSLFFLQLFQYIGFVWIVLWSLGMFIHIIIGHKYYKHKPIGFRNQKLKDRPNILFLWVSLIALGVVMTILLIINEIINLLWPLWLLIVGVGFFQTGNIFRSYYWKGRIYYFFGIISIIFAILISFFDILEPWFTLIIHMNLGLCWLVEGIRGRILRGNWINAKNN